eukprot:403336876
MQMKQIYQTDLFRDPPEGVLVNHRFIIKNKIGRGSFGSIFKARDQQLGSDCALKMEMKNCKNPQVIYEARVYRTLQGGAGIPKLLWFGQEGDYNILAMDLLGTNLEDLMKECGGKVSLQSNLIIADVLVNHQLLIKKQIQFRRIEYMHNHNYIHRDIKPENFVIGFQRSKQGQVYVIDLGLAKKYRDGKSGLHIPQTSKLNLTGTARYASINAHLGFQQSRRDDLESIIYVLVYLINGQLPWQGVKAANRHEKQTQIMDMKMAIPENMLCQGLPQGFCDALLYIKGLDFEQKPNYDYIRNMFKEIYNKKHFPKTDFLYDWQIVRKKKREDSNQGVNSNKNATNIQKQLNQFVGNNQQNLAVSSVMQPPLKKTSKKNTIQILDKLPLKQSSLVRKLTEEEELKNSDSNFLKILMKQKSQTLDRFQQAFKQHFESKIQQQMENIDISKKIFQEHITKMVVKMINQGGIKNDSEMSVDDGQASFNSEEMKEGLHQIEIGFIDSHDNTQLLMKAKDIIRQNRNWEYYTLSQQIVHNDDANSKIQNTLQVNNNRRSKSEGRKLDTMEYRQQYEPSMRNAAEQEEDGEDDDDEEDHINNQRIAGNNENKSSVEMLFDEQELQHYQQQQVNSNSSQNGSQNSRNPEDYDITISPGPRKIQGQGKCDNSQCRIF